MNDAEFVYFFEFCKRRNLDALTDVYPVSRWDARLQKKRTTFQASIDAYRKIAVRSGDYAGSKVEWCGDDGIWVDVWLKKEPPRAAKCTVYRKSSNIPTVRVVLYDEYVQKNKDGQPTDFWKRMPATMLAKCAEGLALRATFPEELGGIYTKEEMMQADNVEYIDISEAKQQKQALPAQSKQQTATPQYSPETLAKIDEFRSICWGEYWAKTDEWIKTKQPDEKTLIQKLEAGITKMQNDAVKAEGLAIMIANSDAPLAKLMATFDTNELELLDHPKLKPVLESRQNTPTNATDQS